MIGGDRANLAALHTGGERAQDWTGSLVPVGRYEDPVRRVNNDDHRSRRKAEAAELELVPPPGKAIDPVDV